MTATATTLLWALKTITTTKLCIWCIFRCFFPFILLVLILIKKTNLSAWFLYQDKSTLTQPQEQTLRCPNKWRNSTVLDCPNNTHCSEQPQHLMWQTYRDHPEPSEKAVCIQPWRTAGIKTSHAGVSLIQKVSWKRKTGENSPNRHYSKSWYWLILQSLLTE